VPNLIKSVKNCDRESADDTDTHDTQVYSLHSDTESENIIFAVHYIHLTEMKVILAVLCDLLL